MNQPLKGAAVNSRPPQSNIIQDTAGRAYQRIPISTSQGNLSKRGPKLQPEICQKRAEITARNLSQEVRNYSQKSVTRGPKLQPEVCHKRAEITDREICQKGKRLQPGKKIKRGQIYS
jgi:hypothetical protein